MFGKGALIWVAGFAMIFSLYSQKLNRLAVSAGDNFNDLYMRTLVHEAAMTAMNFAVNDIWANETDSTDMTIYSPPCTSLVTIRPMGLDTVVVRVRARTQVFNDQFYADSSRTMTLEDSMFAYFAYTTPVSRYFWYTNSDAGVYWISGDTVWGPIHCNHILRTNGAPVFYGKVTARLGISPNPGKAGNNSKFYGGWEVGVDASLPTDMSQLITAAATGNGGAPVNTKSIYDQPLEIEFLANGDMVRSVGGGAPDTVSIATVAPNGVIHCSEDIRVKGVLNGQLTLYTPANIYIDDDVTYAVNPVVDASSDDILGLVSGSGDVILTENSTNNNNVVLHATVIAPNGSFMAENYNTRPVSGTLSLVGSIAQGERGPVGTFGTGSSINHGFSKRYYYDPRLQSMSAPYFPYIRILRLVTWWE